MAQQGERLDEKICLGNGVIGGLEIGDTAARIGPQFLADGLAHQPVAQPVLHIGKLRRGFVQMTAQPLHVLNHERLSLARGHARRGDDSSPQKRVQFLPNPRHAAISLPRLQGSRKSRFIFAHLRSLTIRPDTQATSPLGHKPDPAFLPPAFQRQDTHDAG